MNPTLDHELSSAIDFALIEEVCEAFDPATHGFVTGFQHAMSPAEWNTLVSTYRRQIRAEVEFAALRAAIGRRMVNLQVATEEAADAWAATYADEDFAFLRSGENEQK